MVWRLFCVCACIYIYALYAVYVCLVLCTTKFHVSFSCLGILVVILHGTVQYVFVSSDLLVYCDVANTHVLGTKMYRRSSLYK